jgi:NAD(P)-dependent dehydrogenase (short-subunit alcohol dehydrogenase family)
VSVVSGTLSLTFQGERALVTGAASGIGAATAELLRSSGLHLVCLDRDYPAGVRRVADDLTEVAVDIADAEAVEQALREALGDSALSYVVNCAGILEDTGFAHTSVAAWRRMLDVNLIGAYAVMTAATPYLARSQGAAVVNVTSAEAHRVIALSNPDPNPHYAASKAGLAMLTKTAARALAGSGVRVNSVAPGFVRTKMAAATHGAGAGLPEALERRVPMGRFAEPDEIASAIAFLLSDQAGYVTGSELRVDGGFELT